MEYRHLKNNRLVVNHIFYLLQNDYYIMTLHFVTQIAYCYFPMTKAFYKNNIGLYFTIYLTIILGYHRSIVVISYDSICFDITI